MQLAQEIATLYKSYVYMRQREQKHITRRPCSWDELTKSEQANFLKTADVVVELGTTPKDYICAQFAAYAEHTRHLGKFVLPQPGALCTLGARVRWLEYAKTKEMREDRKAPKQTMISKHYREDRKLRGLARVLRMEPAEVLTERPEEFSREF